MLLKLLLTLFLFPLVSLANDSFELQMSYFIDKNDLNISEVRKIDQFIPSKGMSYGLLKETLWLKLELKNQEPKLQNKIFEFRFPYMDSMIVYKPNQQVEKYGQLNIYNKVPNSLNNNAFKIQMEPLETKTIYIKINSTYSIKSFYKIYDESSFNRNVSFYKQVLAFCYGILISLILYNFFVWMSLRKKEFLYYVVFHFLFFMGIISWTGFGFEYIWSHFPTFNYYSYGIFGNLFFAFQILFIIYYLDTKEYIPKVTLFLKGLAYLFVFFCITSLFIQLILLYELVSIISSLILLLITAYLAFARKLLLALFVFIAEFILNVGNIIMVLSDMGLIDSSFFMSYFYVWGASFEVIIMSLALAYKYKNAESEKERERKKRLQTEELLLNKEKLSMMGELLNSLVHQWRQPLSQINSIIYSIEDAYQHKELDKQRFEKYLNSIESSTNYLSYTIEDFRGFTINQNKIETFEVSQLIENIFSIIGSTFKSNCIELEVNYEKKDILISTNKNELSQVLMIILLNAKDALKEKNIQDPIATITVAKENTQTIISISNNGEKIDDSIINKIFDKHFTTKTTQEGTGLGLYIAKLIIVKLKGEIRVVSNDQLTTFTIKI